MNLLKTFRGLFAPAEGLVCPHCEKPLEGHDGAECQRGMSRRYFFGMGGAAVAAVAVAPALIGPELLQAATEAPAIVIAQKQPKNFDQWLGQQKGGEIFMLATRGSYQGLTRGHVSQRDLTGQISALKRAGFHVVVAGSERDLQNKAHRFEVPSIVGW